MLTLKVTDGHELLVRCNHRHRKQIHRGQVSLIELKIFLKFKVLVLEKAELFFLLALNDVVHPFDLLRVLMVEVHWLRNLVIDLSSFAHSVALLAGVLRNQEISGGVHQVALDLVDIT